MSIMSTVQSGTPFGPVMASTIETNTEHPLNRSIGTDPDTGQFVNEIPDAFYTGPYAEPQNILIPEPLTGNYALCASGTGSGPYTLTMESSFNGSIDAQMWQGATNLGDKIKEDVRLDTDGVIVLPHNIRITDLTPSKTAVGRDCIMSINLGVENRGNYTETFNATVYGNEIPIATSVNLTLDSRNCTSLFYEWNTTDFDYGNYTISAYAWPVQGETNTADNNCSGGWVIVSIPGDITGPNGVPDGLVDMRDVGYIASRFLAEPGKPLWDPNADINGDGIVDMMDIGLAAAHFLDHYP